MPSIIKEPFTAPPLDGNPVEVEKSVFVANVLSPFLVILTDGEIKQADYGVAGGLEAVFLSAGAAREPYCVNVSGDSLSSLSRDVLAAVGRLGY